MIKRFETLVGGRPLVLEVGRVAELAGGAVTVQFGETIVLVTACASKDPRPGVDFLPLTVDYEERLYAAGKIPGGFFRREGRPTQDAILADRLTDRAIRPLFPKNMRNEIQVIATVLSADQENPPELLALVGASAALSISEIPFQGPVGAVKVGYINGEFIINPTNTQMQESKLELVVAGARDAVMMVEAGASQLTEELMLEAIRLGQEANKKLIAIQDELIADRAKPKMAIHEAVAPAGIKESVKGMVGARLSDLLYQEEKAAREASVDALEDEVVASLQDTYEPAAIGAAFAGVVAEELRRNVLDKGLRPDGRDPKTIRPINCEVGILPRTHGSGLFTRGQTQVLSIATLGSLGEEQKLDGLGPEDSKRFMHHYNFPPFSVGETKRIGTPSRRDIGHGALAERALLPVIPSEQEFPYTIRLVSEVLSSNGSTSMASVCGSTLALMDSGVPVKTPVAGVAMGLVMGDDGRYVVLTDIQGIEDALGHMDFKVAGTADGITALQMDIKVKGITHQILTDALLQAREARLFILDKILATINQARPELSKYAPRMYKIQVHPDKIRLVIGPGGKTIRSIISETKCTVEVQDDGTVIIGSPSEEAANRAIKMVESLTREVEVGATYTGRVTRLMNFGAFVEILPGKEGLVHISELADYRVPRVEDEVQVGDEIMVMVMEIDRMGRVNLSRKAVILGQTLEEARQAAAQAGPPPRHGGDGFPPRSGGPGHEREFSRDPSRGPSRPPMGGRRRP
ncbi:MAG: polyribonucleotide nucleotidyltransferase [Dehalococcoidia bacterium]|nr:polyribonucleotide nucleotidyltransferase [Dehalococcoidia bacterium]